MLHINIRTERQTNQIMAPCTHPGKIKTSVASLIRPCLNIVTSIEVNETRRPHTCSRPCAPEGKKTKTHTRTETFAPPKTQIKIHSSPATATTSRRRPKKHVPRVTRFSPASIDPGFMEIGLVQLPQSVKTTNVAHTPRQTDILIK